MKVQELIDALLSLSRDYEIVVMDGNTDYVLPANRVDIDQDERTVFIGTE